MNVFPLQPTGTDDTTALLGAMAERVCLRLNGDYYTTSPLVVRTPGKLEGDPIGRIFYKGPLTDEPLITVIGQGAWLRRITAWCEWRCRGIKFAQDWYTEIGESVRVYRARQLPLDLVDCWYGHIRDFMAVQCRGIGMRTYRCNSANYDHFRFCQQDLTGDDFPNEIAGDERAVLVLQPPQDLTRFTNLLFEPCECGPYPLVSCRTQTTRLGQVRVEGGSCAGPLVRIHGDGWKQGAAVTLEDWEIGNKTPAECLVQLSGRTCNVVVDQVMVGDKKLHECVMHVVGDGHRGYEVTHLSGAAVQPICLTTPPNAGTPRQGSCRGGG